MESQNIEIEIEKERERKLISYVRICSLSIKNISDSNDDYVRVITKTKIKKLNYIKVEKVN